MRTIPKEEIKANIRPFEYMNTHYPHLRLKKAGANLYKCSCPFHAEKTDSFAIWDNGTFKCFGCGVHGDIIQLVCNLENLSFEEGCKLVADNVGVEYELEPPNPAYIAYTETMDNHNRRYYNNLVKNEEVIKYLYSRGINNKTIETFRIGAVPKDEYKIRTELGNISGRIAFPILEHKSLDKARCVGMGYRNLTGEKPKYVNDRTSEFFTKGNFIYGYPMAYKNIRIKNMAIVVEGYIDVLLMHQCGFTNTVALLGTSFTDTNMENLKKLTNNIILFLDGDDAGIESMKDKIPKLLKYGFDVKIVTGGNGKDAADVCTKFKFHTNKIANYINNKLEPAILFLLDKITKDYEKNMLIQKKIALDSGLQILNLLSNDIDKLLYKDFLYKKIDLERS